MTPAALSDSGAIDVQELSMLEKAFLWPQARLIAFGTALLDEGGEEAAIHSRCLVAALRGAWCEHACLIQSVSKFSRCPLPSNEIVGEFLCAPADFTNVVVALSNFLWIFVWRRPKRRRQSCRIGG